MDKNTRPENPLPHLLVVFLVAEMVIYRLMVPALVAPINAAPPLWYSILTYLGLFLYYLVSVLAAGVIFHQLLGLYRERRDRTAPSIVFLVLIVPVVGLFLFLALLSIFTLPGKEVTFLLEASFVLAIFLTTLRLLFSKGDRWVRIGLIFIALPFAAHFYNSLSIHWLLGEEALYNGQSEEIAQIGIWLVILASLLMPYCFGARPFILRAARLGPALASLFVSIMAILLVRNDYLQAMVIAKDAFGIALGPGAYGSLLALTILALSTVTWTLVNCLTVLVQERALIGVGLMLIIGAGYGFVWPMQYLLVLTGFLAISQAALTVREKEMVAVLKPLSSMALPIDETTWQKYIATLTSSLEESISEESAKIVAVTTRGTAEERRTHFVYPHDGRNTTVTIERIQGAVHGIDIRVALDKNGEGEGAPAFTLHAKKVSFRGEEQHPLPPDCKSSLFTTSDAVFQDRFHVLDGLAISKKLLTETMRKRLIRLVHGWVAIWPDGTLRFQVYPSKSAPIDKPIPITALSFQEDSIKAVDMLELLLVLTDFARLANKEMKDLSHN